MSDPALSEIRNKSFTDHMFRRLFWPTLFSAIGLALGDIAVQYRARLLEHRGLQRGDIQPPQRDAADRRIPVDGADAQAVAVAGAQRLVDAGGLFALGNGLDADFVVTSFSRSEPLEEALKVSVTCKPTLVSRAPAWVGGGH